MRTKVDEPFVREARRFALRFTCDDCAHFDPDGERCSLLFDATPRRDAFLDAAGEAGATCPGVGERTLELCKTFELA